MNKKPIHEDKLKEIRSLLDRRARLEYDIQPILDRLSQLTDKAIAEKCGVNPWNVKSIRIGASYLEVSDVARRN